MIVFLESIKKDQGKKTRVRQEYSIAWQLLSETSEIPKPRPIFNQLPVTSTTALFGSCPAPVNTVPQFHPPFSSF